MVSVDSAIERFRDAAMLPAHWPQALDSFAQAFHSDGATVVLRSTSLSSIAVSASIQPLVSPYMDGPIRDPREQRVNPSLRDGFMPDHAYFSSQEIARDPYYQEFLRPHGFGWNAIAMLDGELMVSVKRAFKHGPYDGADLQALNDALPWLRSASRAACLTWRSHFTGQLSAFDSLRRGALLLDAKARVLQTNAHVRFGDGLDVANGVLTVSDLADRDALRGFLSTLLIGENLAQPSILTLSRPSGARPWLVTGIACTDAMRSLHSNAAALLIVTDLEQVACPKHETLRRIFALTATERGIASALASGESLQAAAARVHISEAHARQRLKVIFQKTGTSRQGELIALLAKLS